MSISNDYLKLPRSFLDLLLAERGGFYVQRGRKHGFVTNSIIISICWRYCPQCKEQRQASKKLDLWRLPEVLVIHLKRFSYSRSMKHKLETFVNFPIHDFDVTKYVANKHNSRRQLYELYALTNHYGGMGSGHYTAHIKVCGKL